MQRLEVIQGQASPDTIPVETGIVLGRSREVDLRVYDETASRRHASIELLDGRWCLRDLGSANGTTLNGERIAGEAVLFDGDVITIGKVSLRFLSGDGADRETVVPTADGEAVEAAVDPEAADPFREGADGAAMRRLRLVCDGAVACTEASDPQDVPGALLALIVETLEPQRATICLTSPKDDGKIGVQIAAAFPEGAAPPVSKTLRQRVLEAGEAVLIRDAAEEETSSSLSIVRSRYRSTLAAPLKTSEGVVGFVSVEAEDPGRFGPQDLRALAAAARQAALALRNLRRLSGARAEVQRLAAESQGGAPELLGASAQMQRIRDQIGKAAAADSPVLITGETGTGKELVARNLHAQSPRADRPFVALNCAALVEGLLESEFFGHEKGAFTDASEQRDGRIAEAADGTLFLDEVGDLSASLQAKLLRVLSEHTYTRVGGRDQLEMKCRVLCATNRDLKAMVEEGTFREDLYYRLAVLVIPVPPLRERDGDVVVLAEAGLERLAARMGRRVPNISEEARETLSSYDWPGNVRELFNVLERALVLLDGNEMTPDDLPRELREPRSERSSDGKDTASTDTRVYNLRELEKEAVRAALEKTGGKKGEAAALLGVSWPTLNRKIKTYGL